MSPAELLEREVVDRGFEASAWDEFVVVGGDDAGGDEFGGRLLLVDPECSPVAFVASTGDDCVDQLGGGRVDA